MFLPFLSRNLSMAVLFKHFETTVDLNRKRYFSLSFSSFSLSLNRLFIVGLIIWSWGLPWMERRMLSKFFRNINWMSNIVRMVRNHICRKRMGISCCLNIFRWNRVSADDTQSRCAFFKGFGSDQAGNDAGRLYSMWRKLEFHRTYNIVVRFSIF